MKTKIKHIPFVLYMKLMHLFLHLFNLCSICRKKLIKKEYFFEDMGEYGHDFRFCDKCYWENYLKHIIPKNKQAEFIENNRLIID